MYATGTVECIAAMFEKPAFSSELMAGNLCLYDSALPGTYGTLAYCLTGGNILQWYRDQFGVTERAEAERTGGNAYESTASPSPQRAYVIVGIALFHAQWHALFRLAYSRRCVRFAAFDHPRRVPSRLLEGVALEMRVNIEILAARVWLSANFGQRAAVRETPSGIN